MAKSSISKQILDKKFDSVINGYSPSSVDIFLDSIIKEIEKMHKENEKLKEINDELEKKNSNLEKEVRELKIKNKTQEIELEKKIDE